MDVDRRTFIKTLVAGSAGLGLTQGQQLSTPPWVPPGFPPFYEDPAYSNILVQKDIKNPDDPTTWGNNGGDTAQREGFTWFGIRLLRSLGIQPITVPSLAWFDALKLLEDPQNPGEFRRSPDPQDPDWINPNDFSRDQQIPIVAALGALGPSTTLKALWTAFDRRNRICQNLSDVGGPDHQNLFFRALRNQDPNFPTPPIEGFGEFQLAAMVEQIATYGAAHPDNVGDDLNLIVNLLAAQQWQSTDTSKAAIQEYIKTRPINYGCYLEQYRDCHKDLMIDSTAMGNRVHVIMANDPTPECHPIIGALRWYFRAETGAFWGAAALYEQLIERLFLS